MKTLEKGSFIFSGVLLALCIAGFLYAAHLSQKSEQVTKQLEAMASTKEIDDKAKTEDAALVRCVLMLMKQGNTDLAEAKKQLLIQTIVRVANKFFIPFSDKKTFVTMLFIETGFHQFDKKGGKITTSPTGAVGISQIIPKYAKEFAELAGITDFATPDLQDTEINMTLGAALLRSLIDAYGGDNILALGAYNGGKASLGVQQIKNMKIITNEETKHYILRWAYFNEKLKNIQPTKK